MKSTLLASSALCIVALIACTEETVAPDGPLTPVTPSTTISIALAPPADTIGVGGTTQLTAAVTGSTNTAVTFRSSAPSIATVDATGLVHGVAVGTASITGIAAADTTVRANATVTVLETAPPPQPVSVSIVLEPKNGTIVAGATLQLAAAVSGSSNTAVTYRSSAASIAAVTGDGVVHGVAEGSATITAIAAADTTKRATSSITVSAAASPNGPAYTAIPLVGLNGGGANPVALNDNAQVVGSSGAEAFLWDNGVMTDLGLGTAHTISNSLIVAGTFRDAGHTIHAFTWRGGARTDLGAVHGDYDVGQVVALGENGDVVAYVDYDSEVQKSTIWHGTVGQDLGGLPNAPQYADGPIDARAYAMNGREQIVGFSNVRKDGPHWYNHAFLWEDGHMRDLGVLADPVCNDGNDQPAACGQAEAQDINDNADVAGWSTNAQSEPRAVVWTGGAAIRDIGPGAAEHVNGRGDVAGNGRPDTRSGGFYWHAGSRVTLPTFGGATHVADLSDDGTVVGFSTTSAGKPHAFVWHPGDATLTDLGVGPSGTDDGSIAVAINSRGDVIGYTAVFSCSQIYPECTDGPSHAVLWKHSP